MNEKVIEVLRQIQDIEVTRVQNAAPEKPIVVVGPDSSEDTLRIYAYGGLIARISMDGKTCRVTSEGYAKYLKDTCTDRQNHVYHRPKWLDFPENDIRKCNLPPEFAKETAGKDDYEAMLTLLKKDNRYGVNRQLLKKIFYEDDFRRWYFILILAAASNRFRKKDGETVGERWVQDVVARYYQKTNGYKEHSPVIISDIEFAIPLTEERIAQKKLRAKKSDENSSKKGESKPDFIVFDGESFGFVEMKFDGDSMKDYSSNGLDWHFLDFYNAIYETDEKTRINKYKECLKRVKCLIDCKIITGEKDENGLSWNEKYEACLKRIEMFKTGQEITGELFWCGFVFVGGDKKYIKERLRIQLVDEGIKDSLKKRGFHKEAEISAEIRDKIRALKEKGGKIYCQYCPEWSGGDIGFDLETDLTDFYRLL